MSIIGSAKLTLLRRYTHFQPVTYRNLLIRNVGRRGFPSDPIIINLTRGRFAIYIHRYTNELMKVAYGPLKENEEISSDLDNPEQYLDKLTIAECMQYAKMALMYYIDCKTELIGRMKKNIAYHNRCIDECKYFQPDNTKAIKYHSQRIDSYMADIAYVESVIDNTWPRFADL